MESPQNPPTIPHIPNPQQPTSWVTSVNCECDGGAFVFELAELRPVHEFLPQSRFEGNMAFVHVGRFVLSPVTFLHMKTIMAVAERWYVDHHGALPDLEKLTAQLRSELPNREVEAAARMGFRQETI